MVLSIHQPSYFPWLGLLDKINNSDVYMVMDEVQLSDSAYQHRNLFLANTGEVKYLTIPFNKKGYTSRPIKDLEIVDKEWRTKHLAFLQNNYKKHPYYKQIMPEVETVLNIQSDLLIDIIVASMTTSLKLFGIETKVIFQSQLTYDRSLKRGDLVYALNKAAGATTYLSGTGAQAYLDEGMFTGNPSIAYNVFHHPEYSQMYANPFVPGLSGLDCLFNIGPEAAATLLTQATPI